MGRTGATGAFGEGRPFSPVREVERAAVLDALRGIAVLGILVVNLEFFRTPEIWGGYERPFGAFEKAYFFVVDFLAYGKFITALAFLFGLGLALQFSRARERGRPARAFLLKRIAVLALFGAAHASLVWSGDVLLFYAVFALPYLLFVHRRPRTLVRWACGILGAFALLGLVVAAYLFVASLGAGGSGAGGASLSGVVTSDLARGAQDAYGGGSYADQVRQRLREYRAIQPFAYLAAGPQVFSMMLLGAAVANAGWIEDRGNLRRRARRAAVFGLTAGLALSLPYALPYQPGPEDLAWYGVLVQTAWFVGAPTLAIGWMGLAALLHARFPRPFGRLAAVGRMALTNYLAQSLIMTAVFYGLGLYGEANAGLAVVLMAGVWTLELLWSRPWLSRFAYGPAEWLWRRLSYGGRSEEGKNAR